MWPASRSAACCSAPPRLLPFLVDAVSYLISFAALLFIRRSFQQPRAVPRTRLKTEVAEGLAWVWRQPFLRAARPAAGRPAAALAGHTRISPGTARGAAGMAGAG
jgi:hypothetical protein